MVFTLCRILNAAATNDLRQQVWLCANKTLFIKQVRGWRGHLMMPAVEMAEQQETCFPG